MIPQGAPTVGERAGQDGASGALLGADPGRHRGARIDDPRRPTAHLRRVRTVVRGAATIRFSTWRRRSQPSFGTTKPSSSITQPSGRPSSVFRPRRPPLARPRFAASVAKPLPARPASAPESSSTSLPEP